jgi:Strictosidine synthase
MYIADAVLGLTRVSDVLDPYSKVEIVASHVIDDKITIYKYDNGTVEEVVEQIATPILYADDVTIGPRSGKVYFTDASNIPADRLTIKPKKGINKKKLKREKRVASVKQITPNYSEFRWDTLYASKLDLSRNVGSGRLLEYDPATDQVRVLLRGFNFPNGIAIMDENEEAVVFAETFGIRLYKYNIKDGSLEVLVDSKAFMGYLDGADCVVKVHGNKDVTIDNLCYAVMPSAIVPAMKFINSMPSFVNKLLRSLIMILPRTITPEIASFGGLIEVNPKTSEYRFLLDPTGQDLRFLTGVTHYQGKLYLGSLENDFIGVYDLTRENENVVVKPTGATAES